MLKGRKRFLKYRNRRLNMQFKEGIKNTKLQFAIILLQSINNFINEFIKAYVEPLRKRKKIIFQHYRTQLLILS